MKVKKSSIIMDSLLYIYKLKLKLEAMKREYSNLMAIKRKYLYIMEHIQVSEVISFSLLLSGYLFIFVYIVLSNFCACF